MAGRYGGNADPFSNVDYSLLAPRPFRTSQQYQSVTTSTTTGSGSASPSPSPRQPSVGPYFGGGGPEQELRFDRSTAPPSFLSPQEPAEWGFIGGQSPLPSPRPLSTPTPTAGGGGGKERVIPIKVVGEAAGVNRRVESTNYQAGPPRTIQPPLETSFIQPLSNGDSFFTESFFRQPPLSNFGQRRFPDFRNDRPPSSLGIGSRNGAGSGVERVIPVRIEGPGSRRFSAPNTEHLVVRLPGPPGPGPQAPGPAPGLMMHPQPAPAHLPRPQAPPPPPPPVPVPVPAPAPQQPPPSKTVRFSDFEQHRRISPPAPSPPILSSPVYAEERRAPVRAGSLVRQMPSEQESDAAAAAAASAILRSYQPPVSYQYQPPVSWGSTLGGSSSSYKWPVEDSFVPSKAHSNGSGGRHVSFAGAAGDLA